MQTLLTNLQVLDGDTPVPAQILVDGDVVAIVSYSPDALDAGDADVVDLGGALVTAGLVDIHIHLREPGQTHKETVATGTAAAARGGWTTVCAMPNTDPDPNTPDLLREAMKTYKNDAVVRVLPWAPITPGLTSHDVVDMEGLVETGAIGFSNDGKGVQLAGTMYDAMVEAARLGVPIGVHSEDESLVRGGVINEGDAADRLGLACMTRLAETVQVARDLTIAKATGAHYHLCHASTADSLEMIRLAQGAGVKATAEASPHHLLLADADVPDDDGTWKMNPPLRSPDDSQALLDALRDGVVTVIATDNAPHTLDEKCVSFREAAFGVVTNEVAFGLLYTAFVKTGKLPLATLVNALTTGPAEIISRPDLGRLEAGMRADIAAFDLERAAAVDTDEFVGMGVNTPFNGREYYGECVLTMVGGKVIHRVADRVAKRPADERGAQGSAQ